MKSKDFTAGASKAPPPTIAFNSFEHIEKVHPVRVDFLLETNSNFNTNAPPFEARGCKVNLGGAYLSQGVQIGFRGVQFLEEYDL